MGSKFKLKLTFAALFHLVLISIRLKIVENRQKCELTSFLRSIKNIKNLKFCPKKSFYLKRMSQKLI